MATAVAIIHVPMLAERFVVNPGVPGTVTVHGIGLAARLQVSCVKMCAVAACFVWRMPLKLFFRIIVMGLKHAGPFLETLRGKAI